MADAWGGGAREATTTPADVVSLESARLQKITTAADLTTKK